MKKLPLKDIAADPLTYITDPGTITVNTDSYTISVHDGVTPGGLPVTGSGGSYTAGTGIGISGGVISNTGVLSAVAGTNIAVSGSSGNITFSVTGAVASATALATGRTLSTSGDASGTSSAFDGTAAVTIPLTLATVNASPGTYSIGNFTVDGKGRITAASSTLVIDGGTP